MATEVKISAIAMPIFGITERRYRQLAKEKIVPEPVGGMVDFVTATKQYVAHLRKLVEGEGSLSLTDERTMKTREERLIKEMERKKLEGALIDRDEVVREFVARIHVLKSDLLALPKSLPPGRERDRLKNAIVRQLRTYARPSGVLRDAMKKGRKK